MIEVIAALVVIGAIAVVLMPRIGSLFAAAELQTATEELSGLVQMIDRCGQNYGTDNCVFFQDLKERGYTWGDFVDHESKNLFGGRVGVFSTFGGPGLYYDFPNEAICTRVVKRMQRLKLAAHYRDVSCVPATSPWYRMFIDVRQYPTP